MGWGRVAARQILRERDPAKMAQCGPFLYYLMKGLESLQPFACDGTACLWRGVSRCAAQRSRHAYRDSPQPASARASRGPLPCDARVHSCPRLVPWFL